MFKIWLIFYKIKQSSDFFEWQVIKLSELINVAVIKNDTKLLIFVAAYNPNLFANIAFIFLFNLVLNIKHLQRLHVQVYK